MAYDQKLEERIELHTGGITKKKMFGGLCYLINGNMAFGVHKNSLILRVGVEKAEELLTQKHFKKFDITGRAMKGWVMIENAAIEDEQEFHQLLDLGKAFASSLPPKTKK